MARHRRRGGQAPIGQIIAIVLLSLFIVGAAGAMAFLYVQARLQHVALDDADLCPRAGISAQTIVLLDTTDALAPVTQAEVLSRLADVTSDIPRGGLLQIRVLNEEPARTATVLSLCNPGAGADIDPLIGNAELARKRWNTRFEGPVADALKSSLGGTSQHFSPILAALQSIAADRLSQAALRQVPTRIIVVSDLLENTPYYSHFRDGVDFATYQSKAGARYLTSLAGAEVEYWMVQRDRKDIDPTALAEFWLRWTEASGGEGRVVRLMGMAP